MFQFLAITLKISVASMLLGAGLSAFDITAAELLAQAGLTPERLSEMLQQAWAWALPNMVLGSIVIVPLWCVSYLLRPPRG
ncbi:MAG: hypothetical protein JJ926_12535 [Roseitalea sp.]|uniref:DUF6460 domain-containing protein n=1 Tax=Oceaniradius stylonematis TaxID=2184161 RepID=UPI0018C8A1CB|nr:DUF6460 domain-containing protein [Oceaniradius stylonematis]MBO6553660.1 hypothetical protein [Roseitalea sp.]MBO6952703.1 hypothetical protein [Rhizobiaceae bacterium]MBO6592810.1 hypothetical protein [Roseitalea sp.]MBO6600447.1 hypothetical protein [Roseitalea sp.]MBO6613011.1 hypothetical protein [Roseitalea sp.]